MYICEEQFNFLIMFIRLLLGNVEQVINTNHIVWIEKEDVYNGYLIKFIDGSSLNVNKEVYDELLKLLLALS